MRCLLIEGGQLYCGSADGRISVWDLTDFRLANVRADADGLLFFYSMYYIIFILILICFLELGNEKWGLV